MQGHPNYIHVNRNTIIINIICYTIIYEIRKTGGTVLKLNVTLKCMLFCNTIWLSHKLNYGAVADFSE